MGLALLWVLALLDLAAARDHLPPSARQRFIAWASLGWVGHLRQWRVLYAASLVFGGGYLIAYPLVQSLLFADFHAGLMPGLNDAIGPARAVVHGVQVALAMTIVVMYVMCRLGGYERYFSVEQFWALSKPLLAFSLFWFYFWWASFLTFWYGRLPGETDLIRFLVLNSYLGPFIVSLVLNFIVPLVALIWSPVRRSAWGPAFVSAGILVGTFVNEVRIYVSAFSIEDPTLHALDGIPPGQWPEAPDVLIAIGGIAGCVLLFMLVSKIVPSSRCGRSARDCASPRSAVT